MTAWDWATFAGSAPALRYLQRDLPQLERVIARARGRTACVQAGGHLGAFPKRLAMTFTTVYTFEPAPDLFALLQRNAPEPNIIKLQAALGDTRTLVGLSRARRATSPGPIHEGLTHVAGPGVIPTLRIDDLGLPVCELILLDVEGSERPALQGAVETIARCRPLLCVENNKNQPIVGLTTAGLRAYIEGLGYRCVDRLMSDDLYEPVEWATEAPA